MPTLPSGLRLAIWDDALIEHDDNWFECPEGHFWYSAPAPEMGTPPLDEVWTVPTHAPVPTNREEAAKYVQVLEMAEDGSGVWRGEWLADFQKYRKLSHEDVAAWIAWLNTPEVHAYLDNVIQRCSELAERARNTSGYLMLRPDR